MAVTRIIPGETMEIKYNTIIKEIPQRKVYRIDRLAEIGALATTPPIVPEGLKLVSVINMDGTFPAIVVEE